METKNIIYKKFNNTKKLTYKKKISNFLNFRKLLKKYPLLNSLTHEYNYSFKKKT